MKYPNSFNFFVCDDIRQEIGEKITLVGVYVGGNIQIREAAPEGTTLVIPELGVFATMRGGEGEFGLQISVEGPDGEVLHHEEHESVVFPNDRTTLNVNVFIRPFKLIVGTHTLRVQLNDRIYDGTFEVVRT